jgi:hypothetical protein
VVFLADVRFPGGTSSALANEVRALHRCGLSAAVAPIQSPVLSARRPPHPGVIAPLDETGTPLVPVETRVRARLALVYHPTLFARPPSREIRVDADVLGVVMHHPPRDALGRPQYDLGAVRDIIRDLGHADPILLPVGPNVRQGLEADGWGSMTSDRDWHNLIDAAAWPGAKHTQDTETLVFGRHSRPDPLKWPSAEERPLVYPTDPPFRFRMLGVDDALRETIQPWSPNWIALPFSHARVGDFLAGLDAYAYFHHPDWIEAFGYNVLEALAVGLPTVLPPSFAPLFNEAALYVTPADARALYTRLREDPELRARQGSLARRLVADRFGFECEVDRVAALAGRAPSPTRRNLPIPMPRSDTVLVVTSNGVGVGHVARQIAIARAQTFDIETVFFSLSKAAGFAAAEGFITEYRSFHTAVGVGPEAWNRWLAAELREAISFYRPAATVFDGNVPYGGMLAAFEDRPEMSRIWVRRGMWRDVSPAVAARADKFHLVLAPGELCRYADPGRDGGADDPLVERLPPVLQLSPDARMGRGMARRLLGLPAEGEIALVQLGAGTNFDMTLMRDIALDRLLRDPHRHVVEMVSPLASGDAAPRSDRHHVKTIFPAVRYQGAFDFAVSAAGYNSFHEVISGALPCLFTANAAPEMDLQESRARYADHAGWSIYASATDPYGAANGIEALLDPVRRQAMSAACAAIVSRWDGAEVAARRIALMARQSPLAQW